jgi:MOSC domain-containing protein YiiM
MLAPGSALRRLLDAPVRPGIVTWIGVRPARREPLVACERVALDPGDGLAGERRTGTRRQVTLIGEADLAAIAEFLGREGVAPEVLRRNFVVRGINLLALKERRVRLGGATLLVTGECHPCSRMEEAFGPGGYNAVRGHGGITASILEAGDVAIGDALARIE